MDIAKKSVYWIPIIIIVITIIVFILIIIDSLKNYKIDANEVESYVIRNKIILDENCLAYNNYRTNLGVIDKNKFNQINLKNCLNTNQGIVLNLTYEGNSELILINEDLADKIDFCFDEKTFSCIRKEYNLILMDNSKEIPSKLIIDTISLKK